ncbi:hypothetical protein NDU88_000002 [Pleurodeles waltl]|uniref:Uncharacterized protein n=1 Tax=Pleurodeles waltl TaxID=8319 RepID=A0AAV7VVI1_PLEWA|nr:hypothetical protein NDU88_000002 [Pleurodeles waltl]
MPVCSVSRYQATRPAQVSTSALRSPLSPLREKRKKRGRGCSTSTAHLPVQGATITACFALWLCTPAARLPLQHLLLRTAPQDRAFSLSRPLPCRGRRLPSLHALSVVHPGRPAVGPGQYHPGSRWPPDPWSPSPAPSEIDLQWINAMPGRSCGFSRPPSWPG